MIRRPFLRAAIAVAGLAFGVLAGAASGAQPASLKDRFELSADLEARVAVHQELVTHAGRSPDDFCKLAIAFRSEMHAVQRQWLLGGFKKIQ